MCLSLRESANKYFITITDRKYKVGFMEFYIRTLFSLRTITIENYETRSNLHSEKILNQRRSRENV